LGSDSDNRNQLARLIRRRGRQKTIKRRVIRLVLVPSVVAVVIWLVASGYLVFTGFYARQVASGVRQVSIPAVPALAAVAHERGLSIAYLADPAKDLRALVDHRGRTDRQLSALREVADSSLVDAPQGISIRWKTLAGYLDQLPGMRSAIDSRSSERQHVYDFYNRLLDSAISLFDTQARVVPDVEATKGAIAATAVFRASDQMSRSGSVIAGAFGSRALSQESHLQFVSLVGAYHSELTNVFSALRPDVREMYQEMTATEAWKNLVAAENVLILNGAWSKGVPRGLPVDAAGWENLTSQISESLVRMTVGQAEQVSARALDTGNTQLLIASIGSLIAFLIAASAILWAIQQSRVLVDRTLSVRLAQLGKDAATVVDQRLPDMMERLRRREKVDPATELLRQDYDSDEIGQVADVLNRSLRVAVSAAVDEAKTRAAGATMLMGVARRPQGPIQRGLKVVTEMQTRVGDEQLLEDLFDINHQLTQTRRFLENLIVLSGGQTGRRFNRPIAISRVLLAAIAETKQYKRIAIRRTPDVAMLGSAVAGTTHLLAELLDNALTFSDPESEVWISCSRVKRGIVAEIEDSGVGMSQEELQHANELLATAPTPDVTALGDGSRVGLWVVAELAKRSGTQVTLRTSAYGGLLAIVLLPNELLAAAGDREPTSRTGTTVRSSPLPAPVGPGGDRGDRCPTAAPAVLDASADPTRVVAQARSDLTIGRRSDRSDGGSIGRRPNGSASARPSRERSAARPPLPQRQPQEHLAPELRRNQATPSELLGGAEPRRSPEEARARFARYQQGWRAGRAAGEHETPTGNDEMGKHDELEAEE
jgi:signal transduction histidine kinase